MFKFHEDIIDLDTNTHALNRDNFKAIFIFLSQSAKSPPVCLSEKFIFYYLLLFKKNRQRDREKDINLKSIDTKHIYIYIYICLILS